MSLKLKSTATRTANPGSRAGRRLMMSLLVCVALAVTPATALAAGEGETMVREAGIGMGTAVASLIYAPLKLVYAFGGMVVGGLAWVFSGGDPSVANIVLTPSVRGDYVISRKQLLGEQEIEFFGRRPRPTSEEEGWEDMPVGSEVASASASRW